MTTLLRLFVASLRRASSRLRARLARKLAALSKGAARLLASGLPGGLAQRLCQVAVACGLAAVVAGGISTVAQAGGSSMFRVSQRSFWSDYSPDVARDADGDYVVVWESYAKDGNNRGIYARRYSNANEPVSNAFRVNTTTDDYQWDASVAMDHDGNFVVVWVSYDDSFSTWGVFGQRFDKNGAALGTEFRVNTETDDDQIAPDVAMDAAGNFVVVWQSMDQDGHDWGVYGQRYAADGTPLGGEFQVNTLTTGNQSQPAIAMDLAGNFVVVWNSSNASFNDFDIMMQRYDASGAAVGNNTKVNFYDPDNQWFPDVAMDSDGDFVVVWMGEGSGLSSYGSYSSYDSRGVFGRLFNADGTPKGGDFNLAAANSVTKQFPKVGMDANGNFVAAWVSDPYNSSFSDRLYARRFDADGTIASSVFQPFSGSWFSNRLGVAMDADGDFVIVASQRDGSFFSSYYGSSNPLDQIFAYTNRFEGDETSAPPTIGGVFVRGNDHVLYSGDVLVSGVQHMVVTFSRHMTQSQVENLSNWSLTHNGASRAINHVRYYYNVDLWRWEAEIYFGAMPLADGNYVLTLNGGVEGSNGVDLDGDLNGTAGGNFVFSFAVATPKPRSSNGTMVNTFLSDWQGNSVVARDADGDFVVVWNSDGQDGDGFGVYARLYTPAGVPKGAPFRVNQTTAGWQWNPDVAMDRDGNFVVVWEGQGPGDTQGVFARRYNAAGTALDDEFRVSGLTTGVQRDPAVAMDADGDFVVVWQGYTWWDSSGIAGALFRADGTFKRGDFRVNATDFGSGVERSPDVAMDADGNFVVVWQGYIDTYWVTNYQAIRMRRFDNDGVPLTYDDEAAAFEHFEYLKQYSPAVAMDADGDFVVSWLEEESASYFYGPSGPAVVHHNIRAKAFNTDGTGKNFAFTVATAGYNDEVYGPNVAMDADGDFVVVWSKFTYGSFYNYDYYTWYSSRSDVMAQRFNVNGEPQGPEMQVNSSRPQHSYEPAVAMDADGEFVVTLGSGTNLGSVSTYDVMLYTFAYNRAPTTSGIPDQTMDEDDLPRIINLTAFFSDVEDGAGGLVYSVVGNTNAALVVPGISGNNLGLALIPDAFGTADITIRATDKDGLWVEDVFTLTVNSMPETGPTIITKTKKKGGCVAEDAGAAPWGLLAVFAMLLGSLSGLVRRRQS